MAGRKPKHNVALVPLRLRVHPDDKRRLAEAAKEIGVTPADLHRAALHHVATRPDILAQVAFDLKPS